MPVIHGDNLEIMKRMENNSIDSIVTDPPAGITFMGKSWDHDKGGRDQWIAWMTTVAKECLRVIKPGGHALVWSLPRTSHWTATAWEDAGWEVRDKVVHLFGTGFPKSLNISKQLDKEAGIEREVVGSYGRSFRPHAEGSNNGWVRPSHEIKGNITKPSTDSAKSFAGWGTALKPAHEDWILLRKPLEGTVAQNVLEYGVGGINIDGCRVGETGARNNGNSHGTIGSNSIGVYGKAIKQDYNKGRFPANLIHDGSEDVLQFFPNTKSGKMMPTHIENGYQKNCYGKRMEHMTMETYGDSGSSARFFYCAKPSPSERGKNNKHPTVKSIALMRYLCRLITPPGGVVLDPFGGSGSTAIAAREEGFNYILIEKEKESVDTAIERLKEWMEKPKCPN